MMMTMEEKEEEEDEEEEEEDEEEEEEEEDEEEEQEEGKLYSAMGVPSRGRYCLGMFAPMRFPTPPARRTRETLSFSTAADATQRIARRPVVDRR